MQVTLQSDSFGRVAGTIEHHDAHAMLTAPDGAQAIADLRLAVDSALDSGYGDCFWPEATGEYRWLFRRDGGKMRIAILWSIGTLTGWEHRFWAECDAGEFGDAMQGALGVQRVAPAHQAPR